MVGGSLKLMSAERYSKLQQRIKDFCKVRDWSQFHDPKNLAISLQLESAEVLELFQWTKDNQMKVGKDKEMSDELADVFYWLIMLSNHYNIDLISALESKMDDNERKYPTKKAKGTADKYTEL